MRPTYRNAREAFTPCLVSACPPSSSNRFGLAMTIIYPRLSFYSQYSYNPSHPSKLRAEISGGPCRCWSGHCNLPNVSVNYCHAARFYGEAADQVPAAIFANRLPYCMRAHLGSIPSSCKPEQGPRNNHMQNGAISEMEMILACMLLVIL